MFENWPHPVVFAHRGSSAHAPENTLAAFALALDQGADGFELDAKLSADGQVIVIHDKTMERTTDGHGRVSELSLAAMRELDAGGWFSPQFKGERIPTLDEVFALLGNKGLINVELTNYATPGDKLVERTVELVKRHGLQKRVLFSSFFPANLKMAARLLPGTPCGLLASGDWKGVWARNLGWRGSYQAFHPNMNGLDARQVQRVHDHHRRVIVWTVNNEPVLRKMLEFGVDGIITDDPHVICSALGRQK